VPILFIVLTLVFVVVRILPGDPAVAALGDYASHEALEALRERMGLNDPLWVQYLKFLGDLCRGDLGNSMITGYPITTTLIRVFPYTLELTFSAVLLGFLFGIPLGIPAAVRRNTSFDYFARFFSLAGLSFPAFFLGILLMLLFSIKLKIFPVVGGGELDKAQNISRRRRRRAI
jgi:ABC-type dipeptide/oligopeptide/nickel transport system permease component